MSGAYDPGELLGVEPGASADEIRKAFRRKAKEVHPDVSDAPDASERFTQLQAAHDLLIEQLDNPSIPQAGEDLYRPAPDVTEADREQILNTFRRRREAEERRRARRRSAVQGRARKSQQQNDAFQEEMARRRAEFEARQQEAGQGEQDEQREQDEAQERREQEARRVDQQREREARAETEAQRRQVEDMRKQTLADLDQLRREREARDQSEREARARANAPRADESAPLRCAWKDCRRADDLASPIETALGLRRFCQQHHDEYAEFRRAKRRKTSPAARSRGG